MRGKPSAATPADRRPARRLAFRAYASLNDFVAAPYRHRTSVHSVPQRTSAKDFVESLGIPHVEIDLLLVNGQPDRFDRLLDDGDRVAVFPWFVAIDVSGITRVRPPSPVPHRFALDVHLGRLARHLRLAGLDAWYATDADDETLAELAAGDRRTLLTRDVGLLKRRSITHGYFVRATSPHEQFVEVLRRFGPLPLSPFSRCLRCNAELRPADRSAVAGELPPRTREHYEEFRRCPTCGRLFWKGAHYERLLGVLQDGIRDSGFGIRRRD